MSSEEADLKHHALNSTHDFYTLLSISPGASENEISSAWRKASRKYHPDKVSLLPPDERQTAPEKFYLIQVAYDVLSDSAIRELYDNARRARDAKKERESLLDQRRRDLKEDLERREGSALKRKREEVDAEEQFERELRRLAEDGKRRRKVREEQLRREAEDAERVQREELTATTADNVHGNGDAASEVSELDRSITLRFMQNENTADFTRDEVIQRFSHFGEIEDAILKEKKIKPPGQKHRFPYIVAVVVYKSIVGAHAAVTDFPTLFEQDPPTWIEFEEVGWAAGKEPEAVPKSVRPAAQTPMEAFRAKDAGRGFGMDRDGELLRTQALQKEYDKKQKASATGTRDTNGSTAPSFGSFKGAHTNGTSHGGSPSLDEITMMRLKNAERRRMEQQIRKQDEEAAAVRVEMLHDDDVDQQAT